MVALLLRAIPVNRPDSAQSRTAISRAWAVLKIHRAFSAGPLGGRFPGPNSPGSLSDFGAGFGRKGLGNLAQALAWVAVQ
jgi:hypothetical protein